MNIKKITAELLSVTVIAAVCMRSAYAFPSDLDDVPVSNIMSEESTAGSFSNDNIKRAFVLLKYIGAINDKENEFDENVLVSRGYAAAAFAALASGESYSTTQCSFSDVLDTNPYASGIQQAVELGLIDSDSDKFYPTKNASAEDIASMAVRALKQDYMIYKQSVLGAAESIGIFKGVEYTAKAITKGQFMLLLENVLKSDFITVTGSDSKGNIIFTVNKDENFMNNVYDIYLQEGVLTGYKYSSLYGDLDLESDKIQINRGTFYIDGEITPDCVGKYVNTYVDRKNENKVVSLWQNEKKTNIYFIQKQDVEKTASDAVSFYSESRRMKIRVNEQVPFLYNNVYYGSYNEETAKNILPNCDRIVIIDNDGDNVGDVIKGEKYTHYCVKNVSSMKESIAFKNNGGVLDIDDSITAEFIFEGVKLESVGQLKTDDVLTVLEAERMDKSRVFSAVVTRNTVEGTVKGKGNGDLGDYYIIDGDMYYLSEEYVNYTASDGSAKKINTGAYVQFLIGADNKIVAAKTGDDFSFGFIMSGSYDENEDFARLKIYTVDGNVNSYDFAEKVKIYDENNFDGKKYETNDAYNMLLSDSDDDEKVLKNDVVAYTLNSEGLITSVAKPIDRTAYSHGSISYPLTLDYKGTNSSRMYRQVLDQKYKLDATIPILLHPSETELMGDEKAYKVNNGLTWSVEHYFTNENIKVYNCNEFYVPQFCTIESIADTELSQGDGKIHMYCIENVSEGLDEDDIPVKQISYYENNELKTTTIDGDAAFADVGLFCSVDSVDKLKRGDIIQFSKNSIGNINVIRALFSIQNRPEEFGAYRYDGKTTGENGDYIKPSENALGWMPSLNLIHAKVVDIDGNIALINTSKSGTNPQYVYPVTMGHTVYGVVYYSVFDTKTKKVTPCSLSEIRAGDEVVMRRYYNHVQDVVIIR